MPLGVQQNHRLQRRKAWAAGCRRDKAEMRCCCPCGMSPAIQPASRPAGKLAWDSRMTNIFTSSCKLCGILHLV